MQFINFLAAFLLAEVIQTANCAKLHFINKCSRHVELYDNHNMIRMEQGEGHVIALSLDKLETVKSGIFRDGWNPDANLFEYTIAKNPTTGKKIFWFDLSSIPPNCGNGKSYEECVAISGGNIGFNTPMEVKIKKAKREGHLCEDVKCLTPACPGGYTYPTDDSKVKNCPVDVEMDVIFCPNGSGAIEHVKGDLVEDLKMHAFSGEQHHEGHEEEHHSNQEPSENIAESNEPQGEGLGNAQEIPEENKGGSGNHLRNSNGNVLEDHSESKKPLEHNATDMQQEGEYGLPEEGTELPSQIGDMSYGVSGANDSSKESVEGQNGSEEVKGTESPAEPEKKNSLRGGHTGCLKH